MIDIAEAKLDIQFCLDEEKYNEAIELISRIKRERASGSYSYWHQQMCRNPYDNGNRLKEKAIQLEKEYFTDLTMKDYADALNNEYYTDNEGMEHRCDKYHIDDFSAETPQMTSQ